MVFISVFVYFFSLNTDQTIETVSLPVTNKVVVIDAGHGTPDEGAQSKNGTTEAQTNLKITLKLQNLLEQSGATVLLTRSDENAIYDLDSETLREKKVSDIHNRVKIGNESSADIFVSIHLNKIPQSQYYGWQCFYNTKNENSKKLAEKIQDGLNESIQKENTRVAAKLNTVYIMKNVEIPISIVECGFLSNPEEEKLYMDNKEPNFNDYEKFLDNEVRYNALKIKDKDLANELLSKQIDNAKKRYAYYKELSQNKASQN